MRFASATKDLIVIAIVTIFILILSNFFNVFYFLVEIFIKYPYSLGYIDEIITGLVTLSIGFAVFAWRRWLELKKETTRRIELQEELIRIANLKTETEQIITKQLHSEIEYRKQMDKKYPSQSPRKKR